MRVLLLVLASLLTGCATAPPQRDSLVALSIPELQRAIATGELTSVEVVRAYLARIEALDDSGPRLNAVVEINPDALTIAAERDAAFTSSGVVGPLHGIPVILKANIDTGDAMATTAGSMALAGHRARADAFHVARLRAAGAVILGKANLSEWANFRSESSVSGWSSLGGQTRNPFSTDRNPCGSSSGSAVAVAARMAPLAVGTETDGSIVCPAGSNGVVGIKPTVGLVSRGGIIPIAHTQDTAGPMANTVYGAALGLASMVGEDPADPSSVAPQGPYVPDTGRIDLNGVRVGVWRGYFGSNNDAVRNVFDSNVAALAALGAEIVDPVVIEIPDDLALAEYQVLLYEFKAGLNAYLASHEVDPSVDTLAEIIAFNAANAAEVMPIFGQDILELAATKGDLRSPEYLDALAKSHVVMRTALDRVIAAHALDVIVAPVNGPSWKIDWVNGDAFALSSSQLAAVSGYPSVAVPAGFVRGLPIGLAFIGAPFDERDVIQVAYAFEQHTRARREPDFQPHVDLERALR